jgi:hypothetical protein
MKFFKSFITIGFLSVSLFLCLNSSGQSLDLKQYMESAGDNDIYPSEK